MDALSCSRLSVKVVGISYRFSVLCTNSPVSNQGILRWYKCTKRNTTKKKTNQEGPIAQDSLCIVPQKANCWIALYCPFLADFLQWVYPIPYAQNFAKKISPIGNPYLWMLFHCKMTVLLENINRNWAPHFEIFVMLLTYLKYALNCVYMYIILFCGICFITYYVLPILQFRSGKC